MSIRLRQILAFTGMAVLLSLGLGLSSFVGSSGILEGEVRNTLQANAYRMAESYHAWVETQLNQLETLAANTEIVYGDALNTMLDNEAKRLGFISIGPADMSGTLHLSGGRLVDLSGRDYLQKVIRDKAPVVSDPVFSAVSGEEDLLTVLFAVPIFRANQMAGVLIGQRNAEFLGENLKTVSYGENSSNFILASDGTTIAHTNIEVARNQFNPVKESENDPSLAKLGAIARRMIAGETGLGEYDFGNMDTLVAFTPIPSLHWSVAISAPKETILAPLRGLKFVFLNGGIIAVLVGLGAAFLLGSAFSKPIILMGKTMQGIAMGDADLTKRIELKRADEIGRLAEGFNEFTGKLQSIIGSLKNTQESLGTVGRELASNAQETASAISQIMANIEGVRRQSEIQAQYTDTVTSATQAVADGISRLDDLVEKQVAGNGEAASAIEQMVGNIASVTASVQKMAGSFASLMQAAATGKVKQDAVDTRVNEIASQSELLMEANTVIAGIASQTNLLAMNAAIEAAHAGDAGKGFSVVADEIRHLAETSAEQSRSINAELTRIQETISEVVDASRDSREAFSSVSQSIEETEELVRQIEQAMSEQEEGSKQALSALKTMSSLGLDVKEKAAEMNTQASRSLDSVGNLKEASSTILGSMDEMGAGAREINQAAQGVSSLAETTNESIRSMEQEIGRFKV